MNRSEILAAADMCVSRDRNATHGAPERSFAAIADVWSARLGISITPSQVCIMMADVKSCRASHNPIHLDNWVDLVGYAACGGELSGEGAGEVATRKKSLQVQDAIALPEIAALAALARRAADLLCSVDASARDNIDTATAIDAALAALKGGDA